MSSLILSPQAKMELVDAAKGDINKRAKDLENDIIHAEKEMFETRKPNGSSTINSPFNAMSMQERLYVRTSDNDNRESEIRRQASIEEKLALF